jgi:ABC-type spermidine/putrescine transport system permease subunit II
MENVSGIILLLGLLAIVILTFATIIMPLVVMAISSRVKSIDLTLKKMEHMMRFGK